MRFQATSRISTGRGEVALARADEDPWGNRNPLIKTYIAVVVERLDYTGPDVAMFVTVEVPGALDDDVAGHSGTAPLTRPTAQNVFRDDAFSRAGGLLSPAVAVGREMRRLKLFEEHDANRTDAGQAWAVRVGGRRQRRVRADEEKIRRNGEKGLRRLNEAFAIVGLSS